MIIIWGQSNYGKVDVVPKLFYVATRFFHLYYVPLIPLASYVIMTGTENGDMFKGARISMSFKSVLAGWVRAVLVLCMASGAISALVLAGEAFEGFKKKDLEILLFPAALFVLSVFGYWVTKATSRARYHRAHELAQQLGLPPELVDRHLGIEPDLHEQEAASREGSSN